MKNPFRCGLFLLLTAAAMTGCASNKPEGADVNMGPMPTAPPAAYAPTKAEMSPGTFVSQLQALPRDQRSAFLLQNRGTVNQIMAEQDGSQDKQKFQAIISQH